LRPIEINTYRLVNKSPQVICSYIQDTDQWSKFEGYFILPGIDKADFEKRTEAVVGSRIKVRNKDGTSHIEEIIEWDENRKVVLRFQEFKSPLKNFAAHFFEEWKFAASEKGTKITRIMKMYPKNLLGWLILKPISLLMKKALEKNLIQLASDEST
jgi:hypothetical protein